MRIRKHASSTLLHQLLHASNAATLPATPASPPVPHPPPPPEAGAPPHTPAPRSHQTERQKQQKTSTEFCLLNQSPWDALPLPSLLLLLPADNAVPPPPQVAAEAPPRDRVVASPAPADLANSISSIPAAAVAAAATSSGSSSLPKPSPPKHAAKALPVTARKKSDSYRGDKRRKVTAAAKRLQVKEEVAETTDVATVKIEAIAVTVCKKSDGKGWNCKREAKRPNSLCDYHLSQIRSYYRGSQHHLQPHRQQQKPGASPNAAEAFDAKQKKTVGKPPRPPRSVKEDQDGPEFYYYSGFGPWRGKKRGAVAKAGGDDIGSGGGGDNGSYHPIPDSLTAEKPKEVTAEKVEEEEYNVGLDPESIDDVDDSSDDGTGASWINRRKARKPVKARSLKSLM